MTYYCAYKLCIENHHDDTDHDDSDTDHVTDFDLHKSDQWRNTTDICDDAYHLMRGVILAVELTTEDCLEDHDHQGNSSDTKVSRAQGECTYIQTLKL